MGNLCGCNYDQNNESETQAVKKIKLKLNLIKL